MLRRFLLSIATLAGLIVPAAAADPTGQWLVADHSAIINMALCRGQLWGIISWEKSHGSDENNPNPVLRRRPTLGMPVVLGMQKVAPNRWKGNVYNADDGNSYVTTITMAQPDVLKIEGCVLGGLICSGEQWTRVNVGDVGSARRHDVCSRVPAGSGRAPGGAGGAHQGRLK